MELFAWHPNKRSRTTYCLDIEKNTNEEAEFGLPEVSRGIIAAGGGLFRLPLALPRARAIELILTGERIGAREARRLIEHFGVRGFKFHPSLQAFYPNNRSAYVLYEEI